jgi:hypothetical protein
MKKTFKLNLSNKNYDRAVESAKYEIRQYIKREKRKPLPEGVDFWEFDCKFGVDAVSAEVIAFSQITACVDEAAKNVLEAFYIEILVKAGHKKTKSDSEEIQ